VSAQALDLRRSAAILWRHRIVVGALVALGLLGNAVYAMAQQEVYTSSALVAVGPSVNLSTQAVVVTSYPVLTNALSGDSGLGLSVDTLRDRVSAGEATTQTLFVSAQGNTAQLAERTADAVARGYVDYVSSARNPVGQQPAELQHQATTAVAKPRTTRVLQAAGIGGLIAAVIALIASLAIWRDDGRLRERDAIADAIGVPVLASLRASGPRTAAEWAKLLDGYEPEAADAWGLEAVLRGRALQRGGASVAVLSLSADSDALALGPQLAVFAASRAIPTALAVDPQQDAEAVAALREAFTAARERENLQLVASGQLQSQPEVLSVIVGVVDGRTPRVGQTMRADITLLAVTAGAATAGQLTRVFASAAAAGRAIDGVLVANPIPNDETSGRMPQIARPEQARMPTRMVGAATESRR
jgi:capsular polysaccharide biosynthesis protein